MATEAAQAHCETLVRAGDPDRAIAILFAPADRRSHLFALAAFGLEVARIAELVSEPMPGEIRLQWWHDALLGAGHGDVAANPVAGALLAAIDANRLPRQAFVDLIDARRRDLYADPFADWSELEGHAGDTWSALVRLATIVLAGGRDPFGAAAAGHAGVALGITAMLRAFPWRVRKGRSDIPAALAATCGVATIDLFRGIGSPGLDAALAEMRARARDHLVAARRLMPELDPVTVPAFLPLATVEPALRQMERRGYDPFRTVVDVPQWHRIWAMWRMARRSPVIPGRRSRARNP